LLGPWQKGVRTVPATFRQPNPPDTRVLIVDHQGSPNVEFRLAVRGLARSDRDAAVASLLSLVIRERLRATAPDLVSLFVRHEAHDLPGMFVLGGSGPSAAAARTISNALEVMSSLAKTGPTTLEFERAKGELLTEISRQNSQEDSREATADAWLMTEIYKLAPMANQIQTLSLTDAQRVAGRLFKDSLPAKVVVGDAEQLKSTFGATAEVRGAKPEVKTTTAPVVPTRKPQ
jgi:predicted Zn-dependent peptidase